jgi:hypothetical protein
MDGGSCGAKQYGWRMLLLAYLAANDRWIPRLALQISFFVSLHSIFSKAENLLRLWLPFGRASTLPWINRTYQPPTICKEEWINIIVWKKKKKFWQSSTILPCRTTWAKRQPTWKRNLNVLTPEGELVVLVLGRRLSIRNGRTVLPQYLY